MKSILEKNFAEKIIRVFSVRILLFGINMMVSVMVARILGPEGKGIIGLAAAIYGIGTQFGNLGLHSANTYYISRDNSMLQAAVSNSIIISLVVGGISQLALLYFHFFSADPPLQGLILILSFIYIPIQLYNMFQQNFFIALGEIKKYNLIEIFTAILYPLFLAGISAVGKVTPVSTLMCSIAASIVIIMFGFTLLKPYHLIKIKWDNVYFRKCIPFGIKSYISCLVCYMVLRADIFMLNAYLDKTQTGLYSLAVSLADTVNMVAATVSMLLFPELGKLGNGKEKISFVKRTLKFMFILMVVLMIISVLLSKYAIRLLYGEAFLPSNSAFNILMPGILFWSMSLNLFSFFASENKLLITIISPAVGLVLNVIVNYALIPRLGINGAAFASTISYIFIFIMLYEYFRYYSKRYIMEYKIDV